MGKYSVPESIRQMKPKGTMVKCISGHYYVYEYSTVTGADGKRHTEMGKAIGSIREGIGFIPNSNFACDTEITSLEFGEYAVTLANSLKTLALLRECFNPEDAVRIYSVAVIHFVQGFTYLKDIKDYYDMVFPYVNPGGYIIADNTLWDGHVLEAPPVRDPQTRGIMEFNDFVAQDERVEKVILPLRDGLSIIRVKR